MVYQLKKWHYHSFIPQIKVWWQHRHTYNLAGTNLTSTENVHSTTDFEFTVQGQSYLFRLLRYTEAQLSCIFSTIITCVNQMQNNIGIPTLTAIPLQLLMWHTLWAWVTPLDKQYIFPRFWGTLTAHEHIPCLVLRIHKLRLEDFLVIPGRHSHPSPVFGTKTDNTFKELWMHSN